MRELRASSLYCECPVLSLTCLLAFFFKVYPTMNWTVIVSLTVLWASWLVCGSEKLLRQAERRSHGVRKLSPAYRGGGRSASQLRRAATSHRLLSPSETFPQRSSLKAEAKSPQTAPLGEDAHTQQKNGGTRLKPSQRSQLEMVKDEGTSGVYRSRTVRFPSGSSSPNILASFAGKNRVWIISAPHSSDGYYRLMTSLLKNDVYCELAERHVQQIVLFHEEGEEGGKVRKITTEGKILEQPLDPSLIPKLMTFLKLEKGKFGMVLLKKTLQVEERYPYPVRLEAIYDVIDQSPIRKIEKVRQKGFIQKCKAAGVEGQVVEDGNKSDGSTRITSTSRQVQTPSTKDEQRKSHVQPTRVKAVKKMLTTTVSPPPPTTTRPITLPPITTTPKPAPRIVTIISRPSATTTVPVTQRIWTTKSYTLLPTTPKTTTTPWIANTEDFPIRKEDNHRERHESHTKRQPTTATRRPNKAIHYDVYTETPTATSEQYTKANAGKYRENRTDRRKDYNSRDPSVTAGQQKSTKTKPPKTKVRDKILSNEYEDKYELGQPSLPRLDEDSPVGNIPPKKGKVPPPNDRLDKSEKKKERSDKKSEKQTKKDKAEKKNKQEKERNKKNKKGSKTENVGILKASRKSVTKLLDFFEGKRRLLVSITFMNAHNRELV